MNNMCINKCWDSIHGGTKVMVEVKKVAKEALPDCNHYWDCERKCRDCIQAKEKRSKEIGEFLEERLPLEVDGFRLELSSSQKGFEPFSELRRYNRETPPSFYCFTRKKLWDYSVLDAILYRTMSIREYESPKDRDFMVHRFLDIFEMELLEGMKENWCIRNFAERHLRGVRGKNFDIKHAMGLTEKSLHERLSHHDAAVIMAMKDIYAYQRITPGYRDSEYEWKSLY